MRAALAGVPEETRDPKPDGTTEYSRPLPGKARMYPETDVPPIRVTNPWLDALASRLPEPPEAIAARLAHRYDIHPQQAWQLVHEGTDEVFETIAGEFGEPTLVASVLLYQIPEIRREGVDVDRVDLKSLREVFHLVKSGAFAKEAIPQVLREVARSGRSVEDAAATLGLVGASRDEVARVVDDVVAASRDIVAQRGEDAAGPLMGKVMERLRGRADGKLVNEVLRERLQRELGKKEGKKVEE